MARIRPLRREQASAEQRRIGDEIFGSRDEDYGGPSAILLHVPALAERFDHLRNYLVREQRLPDPLLQLAVLMTARFWSAQYAWHVRERLCRKAGIEQAVIDAIRERRRPVCSSPEQQAVHDYVGELLERRRLNDATHERLLALIGEQCLIELVAAVGFYSMLGLTCDAFEPDLPPGVAPPLPD